MGSLAGEAGLPRRRKIKSEQFLIFNQQFLTLIHAGLPIIQALELLMKRQRNPYFRSILQNVRDRVRGGELLSQAFEAQRAFPKVYTTTILAGEKSGNLEEVMARYIAFQRLAVSFRKKLTASLVYPVLLVAMLVVMMTFLITYVVPQFASLYRQLDTPLPADDHGHAVDWHACPAVRALCGTGVDRRRIFPVAVDEERCRFYADGSGQAGDSAGRANLAEVPGGDLCAHVVHAALRRIAAGAGAGNSSESMPAG